MKPINVRVRNFGSHEDTTLPLKDVQSLIFTGDTGAGKSTCVEAMAWALWGVVAGSIDQAVRHGETDASVTVEFEAGNQMYRVQRGRKLNGRGSSSLEFEVADSATISGWRSLAGGGINDTEKRIVEIVGDYDLACATWLSRQGETGKFSTSTRGERMAVMNRLMNLDPWMVRAKVAGDLSKDYAAKAAAAAPRRGDYEAVVAQLSDRQAQLDALKVELADAMGTEDLRRQAKDEASRKVDSIIASQAAVREARGKHQSCREELETCRADIRGKIFELDQLVVDLVKLEASGEFSAQDMATLTDKRQALSNASAELESIRMHGEQTAEALRAAEAGLAAAQAAFEKALTSAQAEHNAKISEANERKTRTESVWNLATQATRNADRAISNAAREFAAARKLEEDKLRHAVDAAATVKHINLGIVAQREQILNRAKTDAADLDGVPCGGSGEFSSCKYLTRAVESRGQLVSLQADYDAAMAELLSSADILDAAEKALQAFCQSQVEFEPSAELTANLNAASAQENFAIEAMADAGYALEALKARTTFTFPLEQAAVEAARAAATKALETRNATRVQYQTVKIKVDALTAEIAGLEARRTAAESIAQNVANLRAKIRATTSAVEELKAKSAILETRLASLAVDAALDRDLDTEVNIARFGVSAADDSLMTAGRAVIEIRARMTEAESRIAACGDAQAKLDEIDALTAADRQMAADYNTLAQAYGDVPQLLIETIIPDIEAAANNILAAISATGITLSLRTQKAVKSDKGRLAETLDVIVTDQAGERVYERYSGGERFEIDLALRVALTSVLAARRDLDLRTIVIDEGFGTQDASRIQAIAGVLNTIAAMFGLCIVISHVDGLADVMPHEAHVVKTAGISRVEWR